MKKDKFSKIDAQNNSINVFILEKLYFFFKLLLMPDT